MRVMPDDTRIQNSEFDVISWAKFNKLLCMLSPFANWLIIDATRRKFR